MHSRTETTLARIAPRAVATIQVAAGTAMLTSACLLIASQVSQDLLLRGPAAQLAAPASLVALALLTVATMLLDNELLMHGLTETSTMLAEDIEERFEVFELDDPVQEVIVLDDTVSDDAVEEVIVLDDTASDDAVEEVIVLDETSPDDTFITLPDAVVTAGPAAFDEREWNTLDLPAVHRLGVADPPEPMVQPLDADPWWTPWVDRGRRSVFDEQNGVSHGGRPAVRLVESTIDLAQPAADRADEAHSDELAGAGVGF